MERTSAEGTMSGLDPAVIRGEPAAAPVAPTGGGDLSGPEEIDAMLRRSEFAARDACLAAVRRGDARSMARLLRQTGDAEHGLGNVDEAIIAWTRCGLLFPDAATATPSQAAAAEAAAARWPEGSTSRRLWEEARIGRLANDEDVVARALCWTTRKTKEDHAHERIINHHAAFAARHHDRRGRSRPGGAELAPPSSSPATRTTASNCWEA